MNAAADAILWRPSPRPEFDWTLEHLKKRLSEGRHYAIFRYGTCVAEDPLEGHRGAADYHRLLTAVTRGLRDFKIRSFDDGNLLVGFRGPVLAVVSKDLLRANWDAIREQALSVGMFPTERFQSSAANYDDDIELIAGLYARANLFQDAQELAIERIIAL